MNQSIGSPTAEASEKASPHLNSCTDLAGPCTHEDEKASENPCRPEVGVGCDDPGAGSAARRYACTKCERSFGRRDELNIHYTHTHRERPRYACDVCELVFMVKRELSTHVRIHNGEQPQRCQECGMEFGTRQLLNKHNMVHSGVRSHYCPICPQAFFQKGHLTQHMQIHAGVRPHKCPLCVKTFIFKFDLNRHMKIHAERGGNSCQRCGKGFAKSASLDEHVLKCKKRAETGVKSKKPAPVLKRRHEPTDAGGLGEDTAKLLRLNPPAPIPVSVPDATKLATPDPRLFSVQNFASLLLAAKSRASGIPAGVPAGALLSLQHLLQSANANRQQQQQIQQQQQMQQILLLQQQQQQQRPANFTALLFDLAQSLQHNIGCSKPNAKADDSNTLSYFRCVICGKEFDAQPAFLLHWSLAHFCNSNSDAAQQQQQQLYQQQQYLQQKLAQFQRQTDILRAINCGDPALGFADKLHVDCDSVSTNITTKAADSPTFSFDAELIQNVLQRTQFGDESLLLGADSATTSSSSCASSPQKVSPQQLAEDFQLIPPTEDPGPAGIDPGSVAPQDPAGPAESCSRCPPAGCTRECLLEKELNASRHEVDRLREFMQRIAGFPVGAGDRPQDPPLGSQDHATGETTRIVLSAN